MLSVAIIGGMGSGKTLICKIFETLNIPVFYADNEMKKMYEEKTIKLLTTTVLGEEIYCNGEIDRKKMSEKLFNNSLLLQRFQQQLYPHLIHKFELWRKQQPSKFVLFEAAVLLESPVKFPIDKIIAVEASETLRIERIKKRDTFDNHEIKRRITLQMTDKERRKFADFVIDNNGKISVIEQIHTIYNQLLSYN